MTHEENTRTGTPRLSLAPTRRKRTVLIAGGAGFLGSQLCDRHLALGDRVIAIDNLQTGRRRNLDHLAGHPAFAFSVHDIVAPFRTDEAIDLIYNMACPASPDKYQDDPIRTFKTSIWGSMNLLELAQAKGARILQASTSEVYGDPEISPQPESYWGNVNTYGPRSCYDEGKRAAETLFHDFRERHGVSTRIARIFNTYGPRMDPNDGRVVSNFITQALRGEDITIYGDGSQTRSFCHADDLIDGLMTLMMSGDDVHMPVNIGNPGEFTIRELAELVIAKTRTTSRIVFRPLPKDDPKQRRPDLARAQDVLGWSPRIALADGLDRTIPYFAAEIARESVRQSLVS